MSAIDEVSMIQTIPTSLLGTVGCLSQVVERAVRNIQEVNSLGTTDDIFLHRIYQ
jgi:hypothetical protein